MAKMPNLPVQERQVDPWVGRSLGEEHCNPLQSSCLGNPMDRGAWWATVHGVARVGHNLAIKPLPPQVISFHFILFFPLALPCSLQDLL